MAFLETQPVAFNKCFNIIVINALGCVQRLNPWWDNNANYFQMEVILSVQIAVISKDFVLTEMAKVRDMIFKYLLIAKQCW